MNCKHFTRRVYSTRTDKNGAKTRTCLCETCGLRFKTFETPIVARVELDPDLIDLVITALEYGTSRQQIMDWFVLSAEEVRKIEFGK